MSGIPMDAKEKKIRAVITALGAIIFIALVAITINKFVELKNAPLSWSDAGIEVPANLNVSLSDTPDAGVAVVFATGESSTAATMRIFEDASCSYCAQLGKDVQEDLTEKVSQGAATLHINMVAFMDKNTGYDYSRKGLLTLTTLAAEGEAETAWKFYHALWQNQDDMRNNLESQDFATIVENFGASEDTVNKIRDIDIADAEAIDTANQNLLLSTIGNISTPVMTINGTVVSNPNDPTTWGI